MDTVLPCYCQGVGFGHEARSVLELESVLVKLVGGCVEGVESG
jgi:hypothetical protein